MCAIFIAPLKNKNVTLGYDFINDKQKDVLTISLLILVHSIARRIKMTMDFILGGSHSRNTVTA